VSVSLALNLKMPDSVKLKGNTFSNNTMTEEKIAVAEDSTSEYKMDMEEDSDSDDDDKPKKPET
jgi:hypothetical protein